MMVFLSILPISPVSSSFITFSTNLSAEFCGIIRLVGSPSSPRDLLPGWMKVWIMPAFSDFSLLTFASFLSPCYLLLLRV